MNLVEFRPVEDRKPALVPNHAYILDFARAHSGAGANVLDYGCGAGAVVDAARRDGLRAFGADILDRRNKSLQKIARAGAAGSICIIEDGSTPLRDETFDVVMSNQVFEHVFNLDTTLGEIRRILKPGGLLLCLFPSDEVWREGHCGIPFVHWFRRGSRLRLAYMLAARRLGLGVKKDDRPIKAWALDLLDYIDNYTVYRSSADIESSLARHFDSVVHVEVPYCQYRLRRLGLNAAARLAGARLIAPVVAWLCRKLATMVIVCERRL